MSLRSIVSKLQKISANVIFKKFAQNDWYEFAGAEDFSEGVAPIIAENVPRAEIRNDAIVVADKNGMEIIIDPIGEDHNYYSKNFSSPQDAKSFFDKNVDLPITIEGLERNHWEKF